MRVMRGKLAVVVVLAAVLALTTAARARLEQAAAARSATEPELLYLPNGKLLRVVSLGYGPLLADLFYLWAIQYYANYEREDRYRWVEHVFAEVITELDPHYIDAYWLGAMILILEAGDMEAGLSLLEKGASQNPEDWILLYLAGWEAYHAGQRDRAQGYFRRALAVGGAPAVLSRLIAGIEAKKGNLRESIRLWRDVFEDPSSDAGARAIAERQIRELTVQADVAELEASITRFRDGNGRLPHSLDELVTSGLLRYVPFDPGGRPYAYDRRTGEVRSAAGRLLGEAG